MAKQNYSVAVYLVDRAYGGPEEGNWWYDTGDLIKQIKLFHVEQKAIQFRDRMQRLLDKTLNKGRRSIGSVLSKGWYYAEVHDGIPPSFYPSAKPRYE